MSDSDTLRADSIQAVGYAERAHESWKSLVLIGTHLNQVGGILYCSGKETELVPVSQEKLGERLKSAREASGLKQQDVADALDIQRTSLIAIESGKRSVSSIELDGLARLYRRDMAEFFEEAFEEDPTHVLLRVMSTTELPEDSINREELLKCASLCRHVTFLEQLLELPESPIVPVTYALRPPSTRWDAVQQGMTMAEQERKRLGLGGWPAKNLADIIKRQGVRVMEHAMSEQISGLFFHGSKLGLVVVVNSKHSEQRKLFSYAHEYCHVLVDRNRPSLISHLKNREELVEVRANSFAAHFLMPEEGVREFLQTLGKAEATRQVTEVFDVFDQVEELPAQRRLPAGSQELGLHDVLQIGHYYGLSYDATLYQLLNLKYITKDALEDLKAAKGRVPSMVRIFGWQQDQVKQAPTALADQLMDLAFEAYRRELITKQKVFSFAKEVGVSRSEIEQALSGEDKPVEAVFPS